jgi:hypothetical protein
MECSRCKGPLDTTGKTCLKCREKERNLRNRVTETHRACRVCKTLKPHSEFKLNRTCILCSQSITIRLGKYKRDARRRGLQWSLCDEFATRLFQMPCYYCNKTDELNGIDRLDNTYGYINGNCVSCCETCNFGKGTKSEQEFLEMCLKVTANRFPWVVPFYSTWMACSFGTNRC